MRRMNVIQVIPVTIAHDTLKDEKKFPWVDLNMNKVYHANRMELNEDKELDIREEDGDYSGLVPDKKISFIRQIIDHFRYFSFNLELLKDLIWSISVC